MSPPNARLLPGDGEVATLMRERDWSSSSLGPLERWPNGLRTAVQILLTSRFSMWMCWGDQLTMFYNDAYRADTLGGKHPWALGRPASEVWSEIWKDVGPRIDGVLETGRATWDEGLLLFLERSGYREETYHTFSYSPLHDDDGAVRGMLCVVVEETPRLIGERRVAFLGKLAAELASSNTEQGVLAALERSLAAEPRDLPFTLTYLFDDVGSARLAATTGFAGAPPHLAWPLGEVFATGSTIEVPLPPAAWPRGPWDTAPSTALVMPIAQQGQTRPAGVLICGLNPHRRFDLAFREHATLLVGQIAAGLANARAYEHERRRSASLAELDRAKTAFFSNVSHEFRTPLTLMLGPLGGLLADADVAPVVRAEVATIHRNGLRLLKLVNTMLDFSRIEAGRATAQFVAVDLAELTTDLASVFRAAMEKAGLELIIECAPLGVSVQVDRDMWEKIVLNLISNAFKFTLSGQVGVRLALQGDHVQLDVRDSGSGIPQDELAHVFDRFHRVTSTRGRTHEGTGIGLALVSELVKLHDGTISVTSELGRGTTFTVTIPVGARELATVPAPDPRDIGAAGTAFAAEAMRWLPDETSDPTPITSETRAKVLIADDNADMRDYLRRMVSARWDATAVANGREALTAIRERRPDLVITDVMMPELDGFGLVAALRADPATRDLPVLMLSARAGEEARAEGLEAGADDYLVKPFSARDLMARVENQLMRAAVRSVETQEARRLTTVFEQAPVAIALLRGPEHVFEIANELYLQLVGNRAVLGLPVAQALPEIPAQGFVEILDRVYTTGEPYTGHSVPAKLQRGPDGALEDRYIDFTYQPLRDRAGAVIGIAVVAHDVTQLARAQHDAESANRAKDEFLAMLGHELRNPLAPIMTALQLMQLRANVGAERERGVIERQVRHLVGLVDDLLDVSRITRGKVDLKLERVQIADLVARAIEIVSPLLEEHRHQLTIEVPRGLVVEGDAARLTQVVSNLLTNAAKYTRNGGAIRITAERDDGHVTIAITDNGVGIEPAMLDHVFEAFAQAPQSIDRARGGLGLGLAIVANLIKLHGGTVLAKSEGLGHGSEFSVRLPVVETSVSRSRSTEPLTVHKEPVGARILIVDDNLDAAEMLTGILEAGGYRTRSAPDGPTALKVVDEFVPQLAILDLGLPVMDGFELARLLRERPALIATKFIAVTGYGQPNDLAATAAAGFAAHLVKPVDLDKLRKVIAALLPDA